MFATIHAEICWCLVRIDHTWESWWSHLPQFSSQVSVVILFAIGHSIIQTIEQEHIHRPTNFCNWNPISIELFSLWNFEPPQLYMGTRISVYRDICFLHCVTYWMLQLTTWQFSLPLSQAVVHLSGPRHCLHMMSSLPVCTTLISFTTKMVLASRHDMAVFNCFGLTCTSESHTWV